MHAWLVREVDWPDDPARLACALSREQREIAWLDSSVRGRHSLIAWDPSATLTQTPTAARISRSGDAAESAADLWSFLRHWRDTNQIHTRAEFGILPGWIGYIGFAAAALAERVHCRASPGEVIARLSLFETCVILDHEQRRAYAVASEAAEEPHGRLERVAGVWSRAAHATAEAGSVTARVGSRATRDAYESAVRRAKEHIAAGDVYQVNLAHVIGIEFEGAPPALYAGLRRANPASYGALLRWGDEAIASVSPELFLAVRDGCIRTSPIKGTRRLTADPGSDETAVRALLESEKDAAELAMIVDLHRNDLGRVCRYGSVRVVNPRRIERIPAVVHTVADIEGELAPGRDAIDALKACFPAGSISGVPKIRALELIGELETTPRGAYTGAIGVLGLDGSAAFNVAIRTLQISGDKAALHVGAGIVADSDPAAEYEETLTKARRILAALGMDAEDFLSARRLPDAALGSVMR